MLQLSLIPGACLAGILGEAIYSPYDITGSKFYQLSQTKPSVFK